MMMIKVQYHAYHVQAVIRKKISFNKRPRPIVILDVKKNYK